MDKMHERQKISVEILFSGDGRTFINFWNWKDGDDVVAELIEGKIIRDENEISLQQFIDDINKSYNK